MSKAKPTNDTKTAAPAFDRKQAKQVVPVRHQPTQRTINYTLPAEGGGVHCFTGRGEFIATLSKLPKQ